MGGNAIAFALSGCFERVFAIEKDEDAMKCAQHNAEIYGVKDKIVWIKGDCFETIQRRFRGTSNVVIFASPPWGGVEYTNQEVFDLSTMQPYNLDTMYQAFSKISSCLVFFLPRNSDLRQLAQYAPEGKKLEVAHYGVHKRSKVIKAH